MSDPFDRSTLLFREESAWFKAVREHDILDPVATTVVVGRAADPGTGPLRRLGQFLSGRTHAPFRIAFRERGGAADRVVLTASRPFTWFRSLIRVEDGHGDVLGWYRQELFAWSPVVRILAPDGRELASMRGDWKRWNYTVLDLDGRTLASLTMNWSSPGTESAASGHDFVLERRCRDEGLRRLLLAAPIVANLAYRRRRFFR